MPSKSEYFDSTKKRVDPQLKKKKKITKERYENDSLIGPFFQSIDIGSKDTETKVVGDGLLCACNALPCDGICRKTNLNRKRISGSRCPSAYIKEPKKKKREYRRHRDE